MLHITYAPSRSDQQRTAPTVVLCVVALHVLAIGSLLWPFHATDIDNQNSIAMEMVLAPVSHTPPKAQPAVTPSVMPPSATAKATPTNPNTTPAMHSAEATPAATPMPTGRTTATQAGAPAFSLPSSEAHGLNNPKPAYPRVSRRLNEQGQVVVRVFVAADGSPQQGEIKTSSGFDRLDQEALRTVMRWRFVPGQRLGTPEAMWFNVPVNFVLE